MRVLWVCSFPPSIVAESLGKKSNRFGGWIDAGLNAFIKTSSIQIAVCFPQRDSKSMIHGKKENCEYYGIYINNDNYDYDEGMVKLYKQVISTFQPDVVHIWGAEFPCFYAIVEATHKKSIMVCSIQGLCGIYAQHFYAGISVDKIKRSTIRDIIRKDNLQRQREKYLERGSYEERILSSVEHIIGRTDWDKACVEQMGSHASYHKCNETLRDVFYLNANKWEYETCQKHSVFVSQSNYPIKGFHKVVEAFYYVEKEFQDSYLYTTGISPFKVPFYRLNSYQKLLKELIIQYGLEEKVIFLGPLNAKEMCKRYLSANVFVSASSIENSPNSVGEAMMLGMPIVASYVGGTMNMLKDREEGLLYQADAPYMMSYYIKIMFDAKERAKAYGDNAFKHASITHNREKNLHDLIEIYQEMINKNE